MHIPKNQFFVVSKNNPKGRSFRKTGTTCGFPHISPNDMCVVFPCIIEAKKLPSRITSQSKIKQFIFLFDYIIGNLFLKYEVIFNYGNAIGKKVNRI